MNNKPVQITANGRPVSYIRRNSRFTLIKLIDRIIDFIRWVVAGL